MERLISEREQLIVRIVTDLPHLSVVELRGVAEGLHSILLSGELPQPGPRLIRSPQTECAPQRRAGRSMPTAVAVPRHPSIEDRTSA